MGGEVGGPAYAWRIAASTRVVDRICRTIDLPSGYDHRSRVDAPGPFAVGAPALLRRARPSPARRHVLRGRPEDHWRLGQGRLPDHRDRRSQGARGRGPRRVPDPGQPGRVDPAFIAVLTGITDSMVASSPRSSRSRPVLEFAAGSVIVAHNAPFDVGFLQHACAERQRPWPKFDVVDTAVIARRVVRRDEAPNCKLSSLATVFGATTTPNHRALSDARATVDVLHGLIGRLGNLGVHTVEELRTYTSRVTTAQRRKRHLAEHLHDGPGVYLFREPATASSTSAPPSTSAPGSGATSPPPRPGPGWARWSTSPSGSMASPARRRSKPTSARSG